MKKILLIALLTLLLMSACSGSGSPTVSTATSSPDTSGEGYPAPESAVEPTSYPAPAVEFIQEPTWTPAPGTGKVTGVLKLNGKPVNDVTLFLGTFLQNDEGQDFTAYVEPATSPKTGTLSDGSFTFVNVAPGRYSLILYNAVTQYLLFKPGTQEHYVIEVAENGTFDLGLMDYDELPLLENQ